MGIEHVNGAYAVFFDRDGVINRNVLNPKTNAWESPLTAEDFKIVPGAFRAMRRLSEAGFLLFVVSNQPNYAKGKVTLEDIEEIEKVFARALAEAAIQLRAVYYCLHHPQGVVEEYSRTCQCRKPSPYFLFEARNDHGINMAESWIVGDRATDIECGVAAGVHTIRLINPAEGNLELPSDTPAEYIVDDVESAANLILKRSSPYAREGEPRTLD